VEDKKKTGGGGVRLKSGKKRESLDGNDKICMV
jgi:hypothetical protein